MAYVAAVFYFLHYPLILSAMALGNKLLGLYVEETGVDGPTDEEVGMRSGRDVCGGPFKNLKPMGSVV